MPDLEISDTDFAYAAGLIDGEGYISATSNRTKSRGRTISTKGKPYIHRDSRVSMSMTAKEPLEGLKEKFGGCFYFRKMKRRWKNQWTWVLTGNQNKIKLLQGIIPYLKVKQEQAILVLEYVQLKDCKTNIPRRDEIIALCKILNRKGKPVETNTPNDSEKESKIESELHGDVKRALLVTTETVDVSP